MMGSITKPCFCIDIKTGVITIGALDIIVGILGLTLGGYGIITNVNGHNHTTPSNSSANSNVTSIQSSEKIKNGSDDTLLWLYVVLTLYMIYCILTIVFGSILIHGTRKDKLLLLKAWLVFKASGVVFSLGIFVAFFFLRESATIKPSALDFISMIFGMYCLWVVYTLLQQVKKQNTGPVKPR